MHSLSKELKIVFIAGYALLILAGWFIIADRVTPQVSAGITGNDLTGWAWSETIGWISFNSANCGGAGNVSSGSPCPPAGTIIPNYGVIADADGFLSGHAWSEHIGWISFEASDVSGCPPGGGCVPRRLDNRLRGWARALSVSPSQGGNPSEGWDGWISLSCNNQSQCPTSNYTVSLDTCNYSNYAWGGEVLGWISFNCENQAGACAVSNYKIIGSGNACGSAGCPVDDVNPHSTCQDNSCVSVNTCGTSSCVSNADCGGGSCPVPGELNPHKTCVSQTCVSILGCGVSSCASNVDCGACSIAGEINPHSTCDGTSCVSVAACGTSSCASNADCTGGLCVINSFDASRDSIKKGESVILSWTASASCTDCVLQDDKGNTFVPPPSGIDSVNRSVTVAPETTTVYTLSCNPGATPQSKTITVKQPPKFCEILPGTTECKKE